MIIKENQIYTIGRDCSYGYYLMASDTASEDAKFIRYRSLYNEDSYNYTLCFFGCVEVSAPFVRIEVKNGNAIYLGDTPFDLLKTISNTELPNVVYPYCGNVVYKNPVCEIRVFYSDENTLYYSGESIAVLAKQIIFSINNRFYWMIALDVRSYRRYTGIQICLESIRTGDTCIFGEKGLSHRTIANIEFETQGTDIVNCRINNQDWYIMQLPLGMDPRNHFIPWVHPNNMMDKLLLTESTSKEICNSKFVKLTKVLEKMIGLGLNICISDELLYMEKAPDFAEVCADFLEKVYAKYSSYKERNYDKNTIITFLVGATFNKKYYCAVKLAEKAIGIEPNIENTVYSISFTGDQVETIALMYLNLVSPFNVDNDYMVEAYNYLKENDYFTILEDAINQEIDMLYKQFGYSGFVTNSVLVHIIKEIRKKRRNQLNTIYSQMEKEKRIPTKWASEYRLYTIIKRLVPDAIYQYRTEWLGTQSFDIYLPTNHIAIEYQGEQHYKPLSFFGGEESYYNTIERDKRKRVLASEHGIDVVEWNYMVPIRDEHVEQFLKENNIYLDLCPQREEILTVEELLLQMAPVYKDAKKTKPSFQKTDQQKIPTTVIRQYDRQGHFIKEYDSVKDAAKYTSTSEKSIRKVINGSRKSGGGYIWKQCDKGLVVESVIPVTVEQSVNVCKPVMQMDSNRNVINIYPSMRNASKKTGISARCISDAISGVQKTAGGYIWTNHIEQDNILIKKK